MAEPSNPDPVERLTIRAAQVIAMREHDGRGPLATIAAQLRARFPDGLHGVPAGELANALEAFATRIYDTYGVLDPRDLVRLLVIVVARGWHFDRTAEGDWIRHALLDARVASPHRRVERVLASWQARRAIEARNRRVDDLVDGGR